MVPVLEMIPNIDIDKKKYCIFKIFYTDTAFQYKLTLLLPGHLRTKTVHYLLAKFLKSTAEFLKSTAEFNTFKSMGEGSLVR